MGEKGRFDGEIDLPGGSFSRLLLSPEPDDAHMFPSPSPLFSANTPKMLCFGDFSSDTSQHHSTTPRKPTLFNSSLSTKRRNRSGQEPELRSGNNNNNGGATTVTGNQTQRNEKKKKKKKPDMGPTRTPTRINSSAVHAKRRREKLGERIAALQQLVSPYGKTDTASVLHEAMGYIRFLQEQVKALSSPYLDCLPSSPPPHHLSEMEGKTEGEECTEATKGLRSRGLCLIPVPCLVDINDSNGADFWASASSTTPSKA